MRKISLLIAVALTVLLLPSCNGAPPSAYGLLTEFTESYGASGVVYSPEIDEGECGYTDGDFFETVYGAGVDFESDYAVLLSSSLDAVYEAAVFVTHDKSSMLYAEQLCRSRIELLTKMGFGEGAVIIKRADTVFYSTLPDTARAEDIWRGIKI